MITLKIEGMSCDHCVRAVNEALAAVEGVDRVVEVSLEQGQATVEGQPQVNALIAAVVEEGYKAEPAS